MNKKIFAAVFVLLAIVVLGFAFSMSGVFSQTGNTIKETNSENLPVKEFTLQSFTQIVEGKYFPQFSQKELTVNKGDFVRIKVTNTKGSHDFIIDEFGVYSETPLNQEMTVEFVADKAGSFEYYCTRPGHRQNGQLGTLKVV